MLAKGMNIVKTRATLILASLAVLVVVTVIVLLLIASPSSSYRPFFSKGGGLPAGETILARTWAGELGVRKGDAFPYYVEVWYDPAQVLEIDKASFDKDINLKPFEIRNIKEQEFTLAPGTRVYQRRYDLQLVSGEANQSYAFPTIIVRYRPKGTDGLSNTSVEPEPVFVAPRVPPDVPDLQFGYGPLRPIAGKLSGVNPRLPWILWTLGGLLGVLGVADLARRRILTTSVTRQRSAVEASDAVRAAYSSLSRNGAMSAEPQVLLHQMDHLLRIVLARKEKTGWLEQLNPDAISPGIREQVFALLDRCQKAYSPVAAERQDAEAALRQLDEILAFYFGQAEVDAWRN
jgi:hypothetical protein